MTHEEWQEDLSQIRKLIHTTKEQLPRVKQRRASPVADGALCLHCEETLTKGGKATE